MAGRGRPKKPLGQLMVEKGLITPMQLCVALRTQRHVKEKLGRIMVDLGYVSELEVFRSVSEQYDLPFPPRFMRYFRRLARRGRPGAFTLGGGRLSP